MRKMMFLIFSVVFLVNLALSSTAYSGWPAGKATNPIPTDGITVADANVTLKWKKGTAAVSSELYFGTSLSEVENADHSCRMLWDLDGSGKVDFNDIGVIHDKWLSGPIYESSLKAYWKLDDSGTIAVDSSDNGNDGTLSGCTTWTSGKLNGAINIDGTSGHGGYIDCGNDASLKPANLTLAAWVYIETGFTSDYPKAIDWDNDSYGYQLFYNTDSRGYAFATSSGTVNSVSSYTSTRDEWIFLVGTHNGSQNAIYVNGQYVDSVAANPISYSGLTTLRIGNRGNDDRYWNGKIDEVMIFDRCLSDTEIQQLYDDTVAQHPYGCDEHDFDKNGIINYEDYAVIANHWGEEGYGIYKGNLGDSNSYHVGMLELGQEYFWRVDQLTFDSQVTTGDMWDFKIFDYGTEPYKVWIEDSMQHVFMATRPDSYPEEPNVSISLAKQEYESFQIVILPADGTPLSNVILQISNLTKGSDVITSNNIEWKQVGHVELKDSTVSEPEDPGYPWWNWFSPAWEYYKESYINDGMPVDGTYDGLGWWPDVLMPVNSFSVDEGNAQAVWVTVFAPAGTVAGEYTGTIEITTNEYPVPYEIDLKVQVYDFTIAKGAGHFKTSFSLATDDPTYLGDFALKHRINPDVLWENNQCYNISRLNHYYPLGMNHFSIINVYKESDPTSNPYALIQTFLDNLAATSPYATELRDMAVFCGFDEIWPSETTEWDNMRTRFGELEALWPDIERVTTAKADLTPAVLGDANIDIIVPQLPIYDHAKSEILRANGYKNWTYVCNNPFPSDGSNVYYGDPGKYCNWHIQNPPIENRIIWWQVYHMKADGFLYYAIKETDIDNPPINLAAGPFVDWDFVKKWPHGDGVLTYQITTSPLVAASMRIVNIRDGLEDWEYMYELTQKTGDIDIAREISEDVSIKHRTNNAYTHDPQILRATRDRLASLITSTDPAASLITPKETATNVPVNVTFRWMPGEGSTSHDVYLGTSPGFLVFQTNTTENTWQHPTGLDKDQTYYWRIDEHNAGDGAMGQVQCFTTTEYVTLIDETFDEPWPPLNWTGDYGPSDWYHPDTGLPVQPYEHEKTYDEFFAAYFKGTTSYPSGNMITPALDCSDATEIQIDFYINLEYAESGDLYLDCFNGSTWVEMKNLGFLYNNNMEWEKDSTTITDSQFFNSNFKVRLRAVTLGEWEKIHIDLMTVKKKTN